MIITPKENETYQEYIDRILSERDNIKDEENYQERHHITPKCKNGDNSKDNLIWLYAQEHYYAHKLLAIENPSEKGLQLAWWNMSQCSQNGNRSIKISAEEYEEARIRAAKASSEMRKGVPLSEEHRESLKHHGTSVINLTINKIYKSMREASDDTNILVSHISECCRGVRKRAGQDPETCEPYIWRFLEDKDNNEDICDEKFFIRRKILCVETNEIFESIREAYELTGVARTTIKADCEENRSRQNKKRKHFKYL